MNSPKCFAVSGWKNSGKTALVAGLVEKLSARGLRISTIKHAHHSFDLDTPGTDSFRHRAAGAQEVALVSEKRWAIQHELSGNQEPTFSEILTKLSPCDLVIVEGYKFERIPKIEVMGATADNPQLWVDDPNVVAIASEVEIENCTLPRFSRNDHDKVADFILEYLGMAS